MLVARPAFASVRARNNVLSVGRRVFEFGYGDHPKLDNPAEKLKSVLKSVRVQKPRPDPFTLVEAEAIIAGIRHDWGEDDADYVEFQFFADARPSETIAAGWLGYNRAKSILRVTEARVMGKTKND